MSAPGNRTPLGPVSAYIRRRLATLLEERRVVVWYDPDRAFGDLVARLDLDHCALVMAGESGLRARREADAIYRHINDGDGSTASGRNLLIYLPSARGATPENQLDDPFEAFARCGAPFGDQEGQRLAALAQLALPQRESEIARLFREGRPTLALLDNLSAGARHPLVRQALGTDTALDALSAALSRPDSPDKLAAVPGALPELARLAEAAIGLAARPDEPWAAWRARLASYALVSELAFDLPDGLPATLATVPHADPAYQEHVFGLCDRLRETDAGRGAYVPLARTIEADLRLASALAPAAHGTRDTFPAQEAARLRAVVVAAAAGDLAAATALASQGAASVWRRDPERMLLWRVADHCRTLLELAAADAPRHVPDGVAPLVTLYSADDGLWRLDQAQRRYEHAAALCAHDDEIEPLILACRQRYTSAVERVQSAFQAAVRREGWPPEGMRRQTQTFDATVKPELESRHKVAYFLVDSIRYEMGRDLSAALADLGDTRLYAAATILPTITPFGMAALMPGADGAFQLVERRGALDAAIGDTALPTVDERKNLLAATYGDRYVDLTLEELLGTAPKHLKKRIGPADLVVVRTQDIDAAGEGHSLYRARRVMSQVLDELRTAALRLAEIGVQTLVFAADHGHMLLPELPAGDALPTPEGDWLLQTRRTLLGRARAQRIAGLLVLPAANVGIVGPAAEYVAATGYRTFKAGEGYFHEGLSLQECLIPVVTVRLTASAPTADQGEVSVVITYKSDRVTSALIMLSLTLSALFVSSLAVSLAAYDGTTPKAARIGRAEECDARDPVTRDVVLRAGNTVSVPLLLDPDYIGDRIDVRATDPKTGALLGRLTLKNARMV